MATGVASSPGATGIARVLWSAVLREFSGEVPDRPISVNASLNAVPAYRGLGVQEVGALVRTAGIADVPMRWGPSPTEA